MKIEKLNIEPAATGINLDVDGAPEGIHIEWEILPQVIHQLQAIHRNNLPGTTRDEWRPTLRQQHAITWRNEKLRRREARTAEFAYALATGPALLIKIFRNRKR